MKLFGVNMKLLCYIEIEWNFEKNLLLKKERNICFEDIETAIIEGKFLKIISHPNPKKYPNQQVFVVEIDSYVHLVPFVKEKQKIFLKTIIPSRKYNKIYAKN